MKSEILVIDYGMGNLRSVERKFRLAGANVRVTSKPSDLSSAAKIVLPGVGHFAKGIDKLRRSGLLDALQIAVLQQNKPILGICLGMQLMATQSEEGNVNGLGWFNANVLRFKVSDKLKYKVPQMGWNQNKVYLKSELFNRITEQDSFYFVHSYHMVCNEEKDILSTSVYDYEFTSAIAKNNIYGVQFHPEKSQDAGLKMIENFVKL